MAGYYYPANIDFGGAFIEGRAAAQKERLNEHAMMLSELDRVLKRQQIAEQSRQFDESMAEKQRQFDEKAVEDDFRYLDRRDEADYRYGVYQREREQARLQKEKENESILRREPPPRALPAPSGAVPRLSFATPAKIRITPKAEGARSAAESVPFAIAPIKPETIAKPGERMPYGEPGLYGPPETPEEVAGQQPSEDETSEAPPFDVPYAP